MYTSKEQAAYANRTILELIHRKGMAPEDAIAHFCDTHPHKFYDELMMIELDFDKFYGQIELPLEVKE